MGRIVCDVVAYMNSACSGRCLQSPLGTARWFARLYTPVAKWGSLLRFDTGGRALWQSAVLLWDIQVEVNDGGIAGYEILGDAALSNRWIAAGAKDEKPFAFHAPVNANGTGKRYHAKTKRTDELTN